MRTFLCYEALRPEDLCGGGNRAQRPHSRVLDLLIDTTGPAMCASWRTSWEMAIAMSGDRPALHASHFPSLVNGIDVPCDPVPFPKTGIHFEASVDRLSGT